MIYSAVLAEPVPYSAQFSPGTWGFSRAYFNAEPPETSPSQAVEAERNLQMQKFLLQALEKASSEGVKPAQSALSRFEALLRLLPGDLPLTDPYISHAGSICLDWDADPSHQLSLMLQSNERVAFAAYFKGEKIHGSARFSGLQLPESFLGLAKRWSNRDFQ
jgi:hypothetical protein